jgi:L,D-transpeptidase YcbB
MLRDRRQVLSRSAMNHAFSQLKSVRFMPAALLMLAACARNWGYSAGHSAPQNSEPQHFSPSAEAALRTWIEAGYLPDLRWPNFSDYRIHVRNFYQSTGYAPAWTQGGQPTPQAQVMIQAFQQADSKGLDREDYDSSRWAVRVPRLNEPGSEIADSGLAIFDLALTVCAMRYVSDLHIGKVNPRYFHFGLDIEHKKYDLPSFLR